MKVLAMYLPQYHIVEENNKWWGENYTEWTAVKRARPLFKGHYQPRVPLNNNYYDLVEDGINTWKWQAKLAKEYSVYGFCIYHYWFEGRQILEKPMEILRDNKDININYCICWANESWTKTWYGLENQVLLEQTYGGEEAWKKHFNYLLSFFKDERYIKIENKPVINIYRSSAITRLDDMKAIWNKLAIENGFDGVYIISANAAGVIDSRNDIIDAWYNFEPGYTLKHKWTGFEKYKYYIRTYIVSKINRIFHTKIVERKINGKKLIKHLSLDVSNGKIFLGAFPMWDNTPRRDYKGLYYDGLTPDLFDMQLKKIKSVVDDNDFVYINAWNEWGEGAYLEPDCVYKFDYLDAIKNNAK